MSSNMLFNYRHQIKAFQIVHWSHSVQNSPRLCSCSKGILGVHKLVQLQQILLLVKFYYFLFSKSLPSQRNLMPVVKLLCLLNSKTSVTSILKRKHQINKVQPLQLFKSGNQFPSTKDNRLNFLRTLHIC